jgi:hypothetical protein
MLLSATNFEWTIIYEDLLFISSAQMETGHTVQTAQRSFDDEVWWLKYHAL